LKSLKERKYKAELTELQYNEELGKLRKSEGKRIRKGVVLSYSKRHKGTKFCLGKFYQDERKAQWIGGHQIYFG
jgi:hypothetical protein